MSIDQKLIKNGTRAKDVKEENTRLKAELFKYMSLPNHYSLDDLYVMTKFFGGENPQSVIQRFQLLERVNKEQYDKLKDLEHKISTLYKRFQPTMKDLVIQRLVEEKAKDECRLADLGYSLTADYAAPIIALSDAIIDMMRKLDLQPWQYEHLLNHPEEVNLLNSIRWSFYSIERYTCWELRYTEYQYLNMEAIKQAIIDTASQVFDTKNSQ